MTFFFFILVLPGHPHVPKAPDGPQLKVRIAPEFVPKPGNVDLHGVLIYLAVQVPDIINKLALGEKSPGIAQQLQKQHELLGGELLDALGSDDLQGAPVQNRAAHRQPPLRCTAIAPQQRLHTPEHLLLVHRLDHIVIRSCPEAPALILLSHSGRHHEHRQVTVALPQGLGEGDAIHPGHGNVHDGQVALEMIHNLQSLHTVSGGTGLIACLAQHLAHEQAGALIILGYQNSKHASPP